MVAESYSKFPKARDEYIKGYKITNTTWYDLVKPNSNIVDKFEKAYTLKEDLKKFEASENIMKDISAGLLTV